MFKLLCQPFKLGSLTLRNRMVMPPMVVSYATVDGYTTDRNIAYYEARARGGVGLIIQEATYVHPLGQILGNEQGISDDKYIPGLRKLTQAVHRHGAKMAVQLIHGGRAAYLPEGVQPLGPSAIAAPGKALPKELTIAEIATIADYFVAAAVRAKQAGYDGIEIHAAHNYLIDQFLSPASNHRLDEYGGSVENRGRFLVEITPEHEAEFMKIMGGVTLASIGHVSQEEVMETGARVRDQFVRLLKAIVKHWE